MNSLKQLTVICFLMLVAAAGVANAANVAVTADIATSTTWTSDNVYNLVGQRYVLPGATLTVQAGTLIKSNPADQGSLAVCRGAKIFANGTATQPIIWTSTSDTMTSWHAGCNEWGNLTILGNGLISASEFGGQPVVINGRTNEAVPDGLSQKQMEGLTEGFPGDTKVLYGGNNDDDDSGSVSYCSFRYGGKVIGLGNELNGLSLGALGRETDIHHIDIMNDVDDGIEVWGGTVNLKYLSLWNAGDDSLDMDEGYRGKIQFVLIVQGYSVDAARGSGISDNCFEIDGAEDADAQPCTTTVIYNATAVGQPLSARGGTTWRDNAHVQYRNCIFMNVGQQLVRFDNVDGDGAHGYGYNGTLSWADCWTTPYTYHSPVNAGTADPALLYRAQFSGSLCEITDSVFFENLNAAAYTEADARGVRNAANNNVTATLQPIQNIVRGAPVSLQGGTLTVVPVTSLNPCAANDAVHSVNAAPADGFFTPAPFRGAFSADNNWLAGWTAAAAYGLTDTSMNTADPTVTVQMTTTTTFPTTAGVVYSVEVSSDLKTWSPVATIVGTGSTMSVTDLASFDAAKFYRVIKQ